MSGMEHVLYLAYTCVNPWLTDATLAVADPAKDTFHITVFATTMAFTSSSCKRPDA